MKYDEPRLVWTSLSYSLVSRLGIEPKAPVWLAQD
jgi:hypothetical protein